ncbi:hypothetical protein ADL27_29840, partial [Streptomyces sp. NRRL F-6602]
MSPVRRCSRTACGRPAVATLTYVYADSTAVLGPLATYAEPHCYDLCAEHSERLTAPRAWWALVAIAGLTSGLIVMPLGVLAMLIGLVVGAAAGAAGLSTYGSAQIRVVGDA